MLRQPQYHTDYVHFIGNLLDKGHARKITSDEHETDEGKVWYLPHHGVYHPANPKKFRVVFDCSAKDQGISLNDKLLQGPDLTNTLIGVLTRFREEPVAFMCDVQAMFHQVRVVKHHHNFLRFLWWPNGNLNEDTQDYCMTVHLFGATSSPAVANFALKKTADEGEDQFGLLVANTIRRNFYVDDCLKSVATEEAAVQLIRDLQNACNQKGFKLLKFCSNSQQVMDAIPSQNKTKNPSLQDLNSTNYPTERVLGVNWCLASDTFGFTVNLRDRSTTRRGILSMISSVYDPLGFAAPFLLQAKNILRNLCQEKNLGWDDEIQEKHLKLWKKWLSELHAIENIKVKRCIKPADFGTIACSQLHVFSDASTAGYGVAAYRRVTNSEGKIHCTFMMGKARLAPLKIVSIPRLELTAMVVAVRIGQQLKQEIDVHVDSITYHTDSTTVLHYLLNEHKRFPTFVANRIQLILDYCQKDQLRYVESKENPADLASRGMHGTKTKQNQQWLEGPEFLWKHESFWPEQPKLSNDYELETNVIAISSTTDDKSVKSVNELINHYSSWYRLLRAIAIYQKLFKLLQSRQSGNYADTTIDVEDIKRAEKTILRFTQEQHFAETLRDLQKRGYVAQGNSLSKLDPFLDDNLLRAGGRLRRMNLQSDTKFPIILPYKSHVTTLIIRDIHEKTAHGGRHHVLAHLREKFWVIHANSAVRQLISKCIMCRKFRAPTAEQKMSDLPSDRGSTGPPFTYSAVDLFGPFLVKQGRKEVKHYGVLFTCMSSRAIHIETTKSLETDSFLQAMQRFIARRGSVKQIRCDNGTNFVGAQRELKRAIQEMKCDVIKQMLMKRSIQWVFNPPSASHFGGVWERQIRTVRKVLGPMMQEFGSQMDGESFRTLLCEVEAIVNSRPLAAVSSDPNDLTPLTPAQILTMKTNVEVPPLGEFQRADIYSKKRWRRMQYLANIFWSRWKREYLLTLQQRQKWKEPKRNMKVNDLVIMKDDSVPRNMWPMGRITKTDCDKYGTVRSVTVKTSNSELKRPIHQLVLLMPAEEQ